MGPGLAENIDEDGFGASVWMTAELWGVGSTAPYLHDGRATTLTEAILEHDGEAAGSRAAFRSLATADKADLIAFLNNLILYKIPERLARQPRRRVRSLTHRPARRPRQREHLDPMVLIFL